jgi:hypothetical protein
MEHVLERHVTIYVVSCVYGKTTCGWVVLAYPSKVIFLQVLPGNHEAECHSPICFLDPTKREAFENFTAFNHRFRMPSPESAGTMNMWYSFDFGSIHFIQIDTETDYPNAPNDDYSSQNGSMSN